MERNTRAGWGSSSPSSTRARFWMSVLVRGTPQYELTLFVAAREGEDELE